MNQATATVTDLRTAVAQPREAALPVVRAGFFDLQGFELLQRVAKAFATSNLVPQQYQGNVANCMIALNLASRLKADELMVMQNLYVVHGRPGWSAKFLIATFNHCGRFSAVKYEWIGKQGSDDWGCRAWAIEHATGEKIVGPDITIKMAKSEGWYDKKGSKWQTIPQLMLMYRSAAWMINTAAPEISMGLPTAEELVDTIDMRPDGTYTVTTEDLRSTAAAPATPAEVVQGRPPQTESASAPAQRQQQAGAHPDFDADGFVEKMDNCHDLDTLDAMADELRSLPEDIAGPLYAAYDARRAQLLDD